MAENRCGTPARAADNPDVERAALIRDAFRLEWFTIAWMTGESIIAIASGIAAHSISLTAFGIDSVIELASAGVLIWRLSVELKHGRTFSEAAERTASRIAGGLLFALAAYVIVAACWGLWHREGQAFSWPGVIVTLLAIPVCICWQNASLPWPDVSKAGRCAQMRSRRSRATGCPSP
jgi:hypothetical protein